MIEKNLNNKNLNQNTNIINQNQKLEKEIINKNKQKEIIENKIYSDNLSIDELIKIRQEMNDFNFSKFDIETVIDQINEQLEEIENKEQLNRYKQKLEQYNIDTSYCDRLISRLSKLTIDKLDDLDKEEVEYYLYDGIDLDIMILLKLKSKMIEFSFNKDDMDYIDEQINDLIDDIYHMEELIKVKEKIIEYNFSPKHINKAIYNLEHGINEESDDPLIQKLDSYIESMPMEVLEKVREQNIKNDEDTRIIDKAINKKIAYRKEQERLEKQERKNLRRTLFWGFIDGLFGSSKSSKNYANNHDLMSWEKDAIKNGNYESFSFEEQELEEDDVNVNNFLDKKGNFKVGHFYVLGIEKIYPFLLPSNCSILSFIRYEFPVMFIT